MENLLPKESNCRIYPVPYEIGDIRTQRNLKNEYEAYKRLSHYGLIMWFYLSSNEDNYEFNFSFRLVYERTGLSKEQILDGLGDLRANGYLHYLNGVNVFSQFTAYVSKGEQQ